MSRNINCGIIVLLMLLLFQSSMLTCDKVGRAHELHKVSTSYAEPVLTAAFESLRRNGIIAATKMVKETAAFYSYTHTCGRF